MDFEVAEKLAREAFTIIQNDPVRWRLWNDAKTAKDRDLLMVYAVFEHSFDQGFYHGYAEAITDYGFVEMSESVEND